MQAAPAALLLAVPAGSVGTYPGGYEFAPACACASLCDEQELHEMLTRLPVVTDTKSPWYSYLLGVYHASELELPIDLSKFGLLYLPSYWRATDAARPPVTRVCNATGHGATRACPPKACARWFNHSAARTAEVSRIVSRGHTRNKKKVWARWSAAPARAAGAAAGPSATPPLFFFNQRLGQKGMPPFIFTTGDLPLARGQGSAAVYTRLNSAATKLVGTRFTEEALVLLRWANAPLRRPAPNHSWIEVVRGRSKLPEGIICARLRLRAACCCSARAARACRRVTPRAPRPRADGCWWWPLLPPFSEGSGIFLHTGRTLVVESRPALGRLCTKPKFSRYPPELGPTPEALVWKGRSPDGRPDDKLGRQDDNHWAAWARESGYDTVQIMNGIGGRPELISTHPQCTIPGQREPIKACPPAGVELHTGPGAAAPCACADSVAVGGRRALELTLANCFATPARGRGEGRTRSLDVLLPAVADAVDRARGGALRFAGPGVPTPTGE